MTERFTLIECNGNIEDGCTQIVYDGGEDVFILLDLLNSLDDKNEQLKLICQDHRDHAIDFKADCVRLEKENEQLKQYKQAVSDVLKNWSQKNLSAKQLQVVIAIMEELNVLGVLE